MYGIVVDQESAWKNNTTRVCVEQSILTVYNATYVQSVRSQYGSQY